MSNPLQASASFLVTHIPKRDFWLGVKYRLRKNLRLEHIVSAMVAKCACFVGTHTPPFMCWLWDLASMLTSLNGGRGMPGLCSSVGSSL